MSLTFIPARLRSGHLLRGRAGRVKPHFGSTGALFKNAIKSNVFMLQAEHTIRAETTLTGGPGNGF